MATSPPRIPHGPAEKYDPSVDLMIWLGEQFNRFGDIYRASIYGTNVYVISSPQFVEHVLLRNWQNYPKGLAIKRIALLLGNGLMVSKGELWKRQRRMIQPAFNRSAIGSLCGMIAAANARLLAKWETAAHAGVSVNVTRDISLMILEIVLRSIFGDDYDQVAPEFRVVSDETARDLAFAQIFTAHSNMVARIIAQRRKEQRIAGDFLGFLMQTRDRETGEAMSDALVIKETMTLIVAGHETTASTLNWTWYLLSENSDVEAKLSDELHRMPLHAYPGSEDLTKYSYVRKVLEEAMRLYPPGWLLTRRAVKDDQLGDYFVPAGTEIYISPYYVQRHPGLWQAADRFDPDHFDADLSPNAHPTAMLPFSIGPRNCIGEHLARMEMQIHLIMIASRLRLRLIDRRPPVLAAGVNLLSAHDFLMMPAIK
jgi:cytochrome P450